MKAKIRVDNNVAYIKGVGKLSGATVKATDLRAGAALIIAGLVAGGQTRVQNVEYIDRGYEEIEVKLNKLGADIVRESSNGQKEYVWSNFAVYLAAAADCLLFGTEKTKILIDAV